MDEQELREIRADSRYHEAAHAVFNYHAGLQIRRVYVTEELDAECVSAYPVDPWPWQGIELASGIIAGEYAAHYRRGWEIEHKRFSELVEDTRVIEEEAELDEEEAAKADDVHALRILRRVAESPQTKAMVRQFEEQLAARQSAGVHPSETPPPEVPPWDDVEKSYEQAARNVELWWEEIRAVAQRLIEVGHLEDDECVEQIEALHDR